MSKKPSWIKEQEAADKLGYNPKVLRRKVKAGGLNIAYTSINSRKYQYNEVDIENVLLVNSTFIK